MTTEICVHESITVEDVSFFFLIFVLPKKSKPKPPFTTYILTPLIDTPHHPFISFHQILIGTGYINTER